MKLKIKIEKEVDAKLLKVSAGVRYWADATVNGKEDIEGNLIPCRNGHRWEPLIDIDKGQILNWKKGTTADIHYKVCDDGVYTIQDIDKNHLYERNDYVPAIMSPEEDGFGDYIIMKVDENGFIANWDAELSDFTGDDD